MRHIHTPLHISTSMKMNEHATTEGPTKIEKGNSGEKGAVEVHISSKSNDGNEPNQGMDTRAKLLGFIFFTFTFLFFSSACLFIFLAYRWTMRVDTCYLSYELMMLILSVAFLPYLLLFFSLFSLSQKEKRNEENKNITSFYHWVFWSYLVV